MRRRETEPDDRRQQLPALDQLATSLHASFLDRWGRHDPAGLERAIAEERSEASQRASIA